MALFDAVKWGWNDSFPTFKMKSIVAKQLVFKLHMIIASKFHLQLLNFLPGRKKLNSIIEYNTLLSANMNPLSSDHSGSQKYVDYIEHIHPNGIRELFRGAQNIKGGKASYEELILTMSQKISIPSETRCTLSLH